MGLTYRGTLACTVCGIAEQKCHLFSSSKPSVLDGGALGGFKDEKLQQHCKALCGGAAVLTPGERQWQEEASLPFWKRKKPLADFNSVREKQSKKPSLQMGI